MIDWLSVSVFLIASTFFGFLGAIEGTNRERQEVCAYLHPDDRGEQLVCEESPPWSKK